MSKTIAIVKSGSEGGVTEVTIDPGTTIADIKRQCPDLEGYVLSKPKAEPFADSEVIYALVQDGDKLVASLPSDVGSLVEPALFLLMVIAIGYGVVRVIDWIEQQRNRKKHQRDLPPEKWRSSQPNMKVVKTSKTVANAVRGHGVKVGPDTRPYWVQRGWTHKANEYRGFYRSRFGSYLGWAVEWKPGRFQFFIVDPPDEVIYGPRELCFRLKKKNRRQRGKIYEIHFRITPKDVDSGIMAVERVLEEGFRCWHQAGKQAV